MDIVSTPTHQSYILSTFPSNPLTTTFTRPPACEGIYRPPQSQVLMMDDQTTCLPPNFRLDETSFYSPGVVCPSSYYSACSNTFGVGTITTVTCCPIYRSSTSLSCVDPTTLASVWHNVFCTWAVPNEGANITFTYSSLGSISTQISTVFPPGGINAYGVRMVYQATDMATAPMTITTASSASITGTGPTARSGNIPNAVASVAFRQTATVNNSGNEHSACTTIVIAITVPVLTFLAVIGYVLWWRNWHRAWKAERAAAEAVALRGHIFAQSAPAAQDGVEVPSGSTSVEMPAAQVAVFEMPADGKRLWP
ncbi:hypothetical protein MFIFM68171_00718 [Madurella fahalii]|uniref:Transmembrane protein n=1 Tax=Madurella fahalii TaxID=1157608 RepID=A0ABQ0FYD6_9PEZI